MRPRLYLLILGLLLGDFSLLLSQKTAVYPVHEIPRDLLGNTPAVIRDYRVSFAVKSPAEATKTVYFAVTILNKDAKQAAQLQIYYDRLSKVHFHGGQVYSHAGKLLHKIKAGELEDVSAISSVSVYEDNRRLIYSPTQSVYPYTVVYEYKIDYKGLVHWIDWYPQSLRGYATEQASLEISFPTEFSGRFRTVLLNEPATKTFEGRHIYRWGLKGQSAIKKEAKSPHASELLPHVFATPNEFSYDGYPGSMKTWHELARWIKTLQAGKQQLPAETKAKLHSLTDGLPDSRAKVEALYQYLQDNFRYVSIQLGIGGFMPFSAEFVDEKKYGDCKALSNYMQAMLREVGIPSHYTLVKAGGQASDIYPDFPAQQFNHAIICVPVSGDTLWLECTSQTNPFGFLSTFTSNRHVLLITESGGKVVRTPQYKARDNRVSRRADILLAETGAARVHMRTRFAGLSYSHIDRAIRLGKTKETFADHYAFSGLEIQSLELKLKKGPIPCAYEDAQFTLDRYASKSGKRIFLKMNPCPTAKAILSADPDRQYDLVFREAHSRRDTFAFEIPDGYRPEYLPDSVAISSDFGQFSFSVIEQKGSLLCIRSEDRAGGRFPAKQLPSLIDFRKKISKTDKQKIVLVRTGE